MAAMLQDLLAAMSIAGHVCVGLVLLLAAMQKAMHWRVLPAVIANYRLLPRWMVRPAAALLPPAELILAGLLLSARFPPWPCIVAIMLLVLFAMAIAVNIGRGRDHIDCGCGETFLRQTLNWGLVLRNALLAMLLVPSLATGGHMDIPLALSGIAAGLGLFLLYLLFNILVALPPVERRGHRFA